MLKLEEESIEGYKTLLVEAKEKYKGEPKLHDRLKTLISDEKKHAKLVQELLSIAKRQED